MSEAKHVIPRARERISCSQRLHGPSAGGFTMVELLVVMGIIVVLAGFTLPALFRVSRQGVRARMAANLVAIGSALDAYRGDFGSYPNTKTGSAGTGDGFAVLALALLGPGDQTPTSPGGVNHAQAYNSTIEYGAGDVTYFSGVEYVCTCSYPGGEHYPAAPSSTNPPWAAIPYSDGADGFGFRTRSGGYGKVWGPYLKPDSFPLHDHVGNRTCALLDASGMPILYFPARNPPPKINVANGYVGDTRSGQRPMYDFADNFNVLGNPIGTMEVMLGDYSEDGAIGSLSFGGTQLIETAATTAPYLLWAAGPDATFGVTPASSTSLPASAAGLGSFVINRQNVAACDDITNFSIGQ